MFDASEVMRKICQQLINHSYYFGVLKEDPLGRAVTLPGVLRKWQARTPSVGTLAGKRWPGHRKLVSNPIQRAESEAETMADKVLPVKAVCGFHSLSNSWNIHESP